MATPIRIKRSAVPGKRPTLADLQLGEPAINTYDGRIYLKRDTGVASTVALITPWTENVGGSIYYNDGFIGAGTTNPTSRLDIVGDGRFTGVVTATTFSGQINAGVGTVTLLSGSQLNYSGIATVGSLNIGSTQVISSGRELQNILSLDATTTATIEAAIVNAPNTFNDLTVTGVSTFTNGPVFIGTGTSTGTSSQALQVDSGTYISGNLGVGVTNPTSKLQVQGDALVVGILTVTDGIQGIGIQSAGFNISVGVITSLNFVGAGNSFSYNPGTKTVDINIGGSQWTFVEPNNPITSNIYRVNGNVGIGTTNPTSKLDLLGDAKFTGVITATTFNGQLNSAIGTVTTLNSTNANIATANIVAGVVTTISGTNLNYSGVGTVARLVSTAASFSQLQVAGISTFTNGPVFVGSGTTTGTASQRLQVTGGAYVSGSVGVGTTNPRETLDVVGTIGVQASGAANRFEIQHNVALSSLDFIFI